MRIVGARLCQAAPLRVSCRSTHHHTGSVIGAAVPPGNPSLHLTPSHAAVEAIDCFGRQHHLPVATVTVMKPRGIAGTTVLATSVAFMAGVTIVGPAQAGHWVVRTRTVTTSDHCRDPGPERMIRSVGPIPIRFYPDGIGAVTLGLVQRKVGPPDRLLAPNDYSAKAVWRGRKAAVMRFISYGSGGSPERLPFETATLTGRKWQTSRGIHVGSSVDRIRRRYGSEAWRTQRHWWRLAGTCGWPITEGDQARVSAQVRGGRVTQLRLFIGSAGE